MIRATNELIKLSKHVKIFGLRPGDSEREKLIVIFEDLNNSNPDGSNLSINFFRDGDNIHGEALLGYENICVVSQKTGTNLIEVAELIAQDIRNKFRLSRKKYFHSNVYQHAFC